MAKWLPLLIAQCALSVACGPRPATTVTERLFAMGTWVDVEFDRQGIEDPEAALVAVERFLRRFERNYYAWTDGELARINEAFRDDRSIEISGEMAALLTEAQRISALSGGSFDPGIGSLVELWGFHSSLEESHEPSRDAIANWTMSRPSIADLDVTGLSAASRNDRLLLDLGGIAKGAAVDRILEILRNHGVGNALVNAGGDVRVIGRRVDRPWQVGIQAPRGGGILGYVQLHDGEAIFTSGDYERFFDANGKRMHHLLDPRSGYPVTDTQAVTVLAADGVAADAAATAIFVAGRQQWRHTAAELGIEFVLRVDESGSIDMSRQMSERLEAPSMDGYSEKL